MEELPLLAKAREAFEETRRQLWEARRQERESLQRADHERRVALKAVLLPFQGDFTAYLAKTTQARVQAYEANLRDYEAYIEEEQERMREEQELARRKREEQEAREREARERARQGELMLFIIVVVG